MEVSDSSFASVCVRRKLSVAGAADECISAI